MSNPRVIEFFTPKGDFGWLSNYSMKYPFTLDNIVWKSVQHYFEAARFVNYPIKALIAGQRSPQEAAKLARDISKKTYLNVDVPDRKDKAGHQLYLTEDEEKHFTKELYDILGPKVDPEDPRIIREPGIASRLDTQQKRALQNLIVTGRLAPIPGVKYADDFHPKYSIALVIGPYLPSEIDLNFIWEKAQSIKDITQFDADADEDFRKYITGFLDQQKARLAQIEHIRKQYAGREVPSEERPAPERRLNPREERFYKESRNILIKVGLLNKEIRKLIKERESAYYLQKTDPETVPNWGEKNKKGILVYQEGAMKDAMMAKFEQNREAKVNLVKTCVKRDNRCDGKKLIYNNTKNSYWGIGKGRGRNRIGVLLMEVRDVLVKTTVMPKGPPLPTLPFMYIKIDRQGKSTALAWLKLRLFDLMRTVYITKRYVVKERKMRAPQDEEQPLVDITFIRNIIIKIEGCNDFAIEVDDPNAADLRPKKDPATLEIGTEEMGSYNQLFVVSVKGRTKVWENAYYAQFKKWVLEWYREKQNPNFQIRLTDGALKLCWSYLVWLIREIARIIPTSPITRVAFQKAIVSCRQSITQKQCEQDLLFVSSREYQIPTLSICYMNSIMHVMIGLMDIRRANYVTPRKAFTASEIILLPQDYTRGFDYVSNIMSEEERADLAPFIANIEIKDPDDDEEAQNIQGRAFVDYLSQKYNLQDYIEYTSQFIFNAGEEWKNPRVLAVISLWLKYIENVRNADETRRIKFYVEPLEYYQKNIYDWEKPIGYI